MNPYHYADEDSQKCPQRYEGLLLYDWNENNSIMESTFFKAIDILTFRGIRHKEEIST
jgi:hypothetical protein